MLSYLYTTDIWQPVSWMAFVPRLGFLVSVKSLLHKCWWFRWKVFGEVLPSKWRYGVGPWRSWISTYQNLSISRLGSSTEPFLSTLKDGVFPANPQVFFYISLLISITFYFIVQLCVVKVVSVLRCEFFEDTHAYTTGFRILLFT